MSTTGQASKQETDDILANSVLGPINLLHKLHHLRGTKQLDA